MEGFLAEQQKRMEQLQQRMDDEFALDDLSSSTRERILNSPKKKYAMCMALPKNAPVCMKKFPRDTLYVVGDSVFCGPHAHKETGLSTAMMTKYDPKLHPQFVSCSTTSSPASSSSNSLRSSTASIPATTRSSRSSSLASSTSTISNPESPEPLNRKSRTARPEVTKDDLTAMEDRITRALTAALTTEFNKTKEYIDHRIKQQNESVIIPMLEQLEDPDYEPEAEEAEEAEEDDDDEPEPEAPEQKRQRVEQPDVTLIPPPPPAPPVSQQPPRGRIQLLKNMLTGNRSPRS